MDTCTKNAAHTSHHQAPPQPPSKVFTAISPMYIPFRKSSTQVSGDRTLQLVPSKLTSHGSEKKKESLEEFPATRFVQRCNATKGDQHPPTAWMLWKAAPTTGCTPLAPCLTLSASCPIPSFSFAVLPLFDTPSLQLSYPNFSKTF